MTDAHAPLTMGGHPVDSLALAPSALRREMAETLALLPAPDQIKLVKEWFIATGTTWTPPANAANPRDTWGPLEGELTMFGVFATGETLDAAIAQWIKYVRRMDRAMEDAA
jgi:hypothetical protein